jgi:hypothetical protein
MKGNLIDDYPKRSSYYYEDEPNLINNIDVGDRFGLFIYLIDTLVLLC